MRSDRYWEDLPESELKQMVKIKYNFINLRNGLFESSQMDLRHSQP